MDLIPKKDVKSEEWKPNKEDSFPTWHKVGKVKSMFVYPLLKGVAESVTSCGIYCNQICGYKNKFPVLNHMFVVYDEVTNVIYTKNEIPKFKTFTVSFLDKNAVALKGHSNSIVLILQHIMADGNIKTCMTSFSNKFLVFVQVLDCGDAIAEWLRNYTNNNHLRLGYIFNLELQNTKLEETTNQFKKWNMDNKSYKDFMMPFECVPPLTLISSETFDEIVRTCSHEQLQQLSPNIVISSTDEKPFNEKKWQKIRIGDHVIVNNINNINLKDRPISQINLKDTPIDMKWELVLLHCEVLFSGIVEKGDEVFALYA
ncbi:mitochondrial amidoxime reducing component 2-like [Odontomachus brunneus]|uniref:mitochondrial amidoxime reducing component 2-like n=1 Tax=Odontomachus brunneus TaxID=486640 RepID=UPI0013F242EB|nr:mitochondrial amidoxime reducing component 2-like [Odontomachus brunneus]